MRGKRGDPMAALGLSPRSASSSGATRPQPRSKPADPVKVEARAQLNEALIQLPEEYCVAIREALRAFAVRSVREQEKERRRSG